MAIMEGTRAVKSWVGTYSFAIDGGAVSSITIRSESGPIPSGAVIVSGYIDVTTALTAAANGELAIRVEGAGDTVASAVVAGAPWSTTGRKAIIEAATGDTAVKTTASRSPLAVVTVAAITAGVFTLVLIYR